MRMLWIQIVIIASVAAFQCSQEPLGQITWQDNLEVALASGKPVLADFFSPT